MLHKLPNISDHPFPQHTHTCPSPYKKKSVSPTVWEFLKRQKDTDRKRNRGERENKKKIIQELAQENFTKLKS